VIARRESDYSPLPLVRRKLQKTVGGAPQLERAAGLKALAFQPEAMSLDLALDQRRALDQALDAGSRFQDVIGRKLRAFR